MLVSNYSSSSSSGSSGCAGEAFFPVEDAVGELMVTGDAVSLAGSGVPFTAASTSASVFIVTSASTSAVPASF